MTSISKIPASYVISNVLVFFWEELREEAALGGQNLELARHFCSSRGEEGMGVGSRYLIPPMLDSSHPLLRKIHFWCCCCYLEPKWLQMRVTAPLLDTKLPTNTTNWPADPGHLDIAQELMRITKTNTNLELKSSFMAASNHSFIKLRGSTVSIKDINMSTQWVWSKTTLQVSKTSFVICYLESTNTSVGFVCFFDHPKLF